MPEAVLLRPWIAEIVKLVLVAGAPTVAEGKQNSGAWESKQKADLANWTPRASNGQRGNWKRESKCN